MTTFVAVTVRQYSNGTCWTSDITLHHGYMYTTHWSCLWTVTLIFSPVASFARNYKLDGPLVFMAMHKKDKGSHDILNIKGDDIISVTWIIQMSHEAYYFEMSQCLVWRMSNNFKWILGLAYSMGMCISLRCWICHCGYLHYCVCVVYVCVFVCVCLCVYVCVCMFVCVCVCVVCVNECVCVGICVYVFAYRVFVCVAA